MEKGEAHMYTVVADDSDEVLGTIGIWKIDWNGSQTYEMGWFVLPAYQGKGVATEAARLIISQARSNPEMRSIHAYPAVTNAASNAIARKIGVENQGDATTKTSLACCAATIGASTSARHLFKLYHKALNIVLQSTG
jgi:RimJ/RimL family protein N-acetyltransferase